MAVITRTFPADVARAGHEPVGRGGGRRDARRADPRRRARRRARLGVDLLRQRAGRRRRPRARASGSSPSCPPTCAGSTCSGVVLSAVGMFLLVFGIQEGQTYDWGTIAGPISVWSLIVAGIVVLALFVALAGAQHTRSRCCRSTCSATATSASPAVAIAAVGFGVTAMAFPTMLYAQGVLGLSPDARGAALRPDGGDLGQPVALRRTAHRPRAPAVGRRVRARVLHRRPGLAGGGDGRQPRPSGSCCCRSRSSAWPTGTCGRRSRRRPPATCR